MGNILLVGRRLNFKRRIIKKGKHRIIILHRKWIELMIVALRTLQGDPQPDRSRGIYTVKNLIHSIPLGTHSRFHITSDRSMKARRYFLT